jgi:hypothetical protein
MRLHVMALSHLALLVRPASNLSDPHDLAIIRRHDIPDSAYVQRGLGFASLAHLYLPTPQGAADGEGTLIAPRWVLTAAHVGSEIRRGHLVIVGSQQIAVDSIVIHPQWNDGPHDLALLRLAQPAIVRPAQLYRQSAEADQLIVLVGYGDFGTGEKGPEGNDRVVRGASNRIDEATDLWLKFAFDPPNHPRTTPLEGVSGPGDSGGPAYLDGAPGEVLIGVSSGQSTRAAGGPGRYGVVEYYVRVSRYISWIESITGPLPGSR